MKFKIFESVGGISEDTKNWLDMISMPRGGEFIRFTRYTADMEKELAGYKPSHPITLYRAVDEPQINSNVSKITGVESWSKSREQAKNFGSNVIRKMFNPEDILVDTTLLPSDMFEQGEEEVLVKVRNGGKKDEI